jgi:hypothetical protein
LREFPRSTAHCVPRSSSPTLYLRYDERYVYGVPELKSITRRLEWSPTSPVFDRRTPVRAEWPALKFELRLAGGPEELSAR